MYDLPHAFHLETPVGADPRVDAGDSGRRDNRKQLLDKVVLGLLVLAVLSTALTVGLTLPTVVPPSLATIAPPPANDRTVAAYSGLGAWVDVYDYAPSFQQGATTPSIGPAAVASAGQLGARTLYLQAAHTRSSGVVDADTVGELLRAAHDAGMNVVAWYVPAFADLDADFGRVLALHEFDAGGHRFDGIALDIEWVDSVPDHTERSERLVELSSRLRTAVGDDALGAIVLPPSLLEDVNPDRWANFPWDDLAGIYDAWLPMSYWTQRRGELADPTVYTTRNVTLLRQLLGDDDAVIHVIGGVGDRLNADDYAEFINAVAPMGVAGASVYDLRTTTIDGMSRLGADLQGALSQGALVE